VGCHANVNLKGISGIPGAVRLRSVEATRGAGHTVRSLGAGGHNEPGVTSLKVNYPGESIG
jgi:hypothetical protein